MFFGERPPPCLRRSGSDVVESGIGSSPCFCSVNDHSIRENLHSLTGLVKADRYDGPVTPGTGEDIRRPRGLGWLGIDIGCVLVFCAVGRRSHDEGLNVAGVAATAWPFLTGTILGWVLSGGWRRPTAVAPTGVAVWVCTVAVGMLLRKLTSAGVAVSFVVVASSVTALLLLGWRAALLPVWRRMRTTSPK